ncbi:MAG: hypothetical protein ABI643_03875 [Candidatus Doudnabacteria bacterium]
MRNTLRFFGTLMVCAGVLIGTGTCSVDRTPTSPSPMPPVALPPPSTGIKVGELLKFTLDPAPSPGGVGANIAPITDGTLDFMLTNVAGNIVVSLHWLQDLTISPSIGEKVEIAAGSATASLVVGGKVNYVRITNISPYIVTGDKIVIYLR